MSTMVTQCACNVGPLCVYTRILWDIGCKHEKESYPRGLCWHARYFRCPPTAGWWACDQRSSSSSSLTPLLLPRYSFKLSNRVSIRLPAFVSHVDCSTNCLLTLFESRTTTTSFADLIGRNPLWQRDSNDSMDRSEKWFYSSFFEKRFT